MSTFAHPKEVHKLQLLATNKTSFFCGEGECRVAHSSFGDSCKRLASRENGSLPLHYSTKPITNGSSYPEGNFGGTQLLGGSMSLSPLYRALTNDLHVSTAMPTSIAVSSDFVVARHSSPPFGSHRICLRSTGVLRTSCRRSLRASVILICTHPHERSKGIAPF